MPRRSTRNAPYFVDFETARLQEDPEMRGEAKDMSSLRELVGQRCSTRRGTPDKKPRMPGTVGSGQRALLLACLRLGLLAMSMMLNGCQTYPPDGGSIFATPAHRAERFLAQGHPKKALAVIQRNKSYFGDLSDSRLTALRCRVANQLDLDLTTRSQAALETLQSSTRATDSTSWQVARHALAQAEQIRQLAAGYGSVLSDCYVHSSMTGNLLRELDSVRKDFDVRWRNDFLDFSEYALTDFRRLYPSPPPDSAFADPTLWQSRLEGSKAHEIVEAYATYSTAVDLNVMPSFREAVSRAGRKETASMSVEAQLAYWLDTYEHAEEKGLQLKEFAPRVQIVSIISPDRFIGPSILVQEEDGIMRITEELSSALSSGIRPSLDMIVVVAASSANAERELGEPESVASRRIVGRETVSNPRYHELLTAIGAAKVEIERAQAELSRISSSYCEGLACFVKAAALVGARERENEAVSEFHVLSAALSGHSPTITQPVFSKYEYRVVPFDARRRVRATVGIFDRLAGSLYQGSLSLEENREFEVPYRLDPDDPDAEHIRSNLDSEASVLDFENGAIPWRPIPDLLRILSDEPPLRTDAENVEMRLRTMTRTAHGFTSGHSILQPRSEPDSHDRTRSVVVVENPNGSRGSGFFVAPDLIVTNQHVTDGTSSVWVRDMSGRRRTGRVLAVDAMRDLALIGSDMEGSPVRFFDGEELEVGDTVDAIGHPKGMEFSLTRGIVSALRSVPTEFGGGEIRAIQTDAAISPGNSGGPLFMGDRVVGMCSWKTIGEGAEGLGFAIHYSEIARFLNR